MSVEVFEDLVGHVFVKVTGKAGDETMQFVREDGAIFEFYHQQDCCEMVSIDDVCGDLSDLVGSTILIAEAVSNAPFTEDMRKKSDKEESFTWTFYKFATAKGHVTVRWFGVSNGYYSEHVDFRQVKEPDDAQAAKEELMNFHRKLGDTFVVLTKGIENLCNSGLLSKDALDQVGRLSGTIALSWVDIDRMIWEEVERNRMDCRSTKEKR